jgi:3-oxoacyl-[acyl-carrier-protein] synthase-3
MPQPIAIIGFGYAVPPQIRTNQDPIFDWLRMHGFPPDAAGPFTGFKHRRVLPAPDWQGPPTKPNTVSDLMVTACQHALTEAELEPNDIDLLVGWASISEFLTPNALSVVHKELNLRDDAWLLPIEGLENFSTALMTADAMIKACRGKNALVVSGCNWSQYVDYHTPQSASAADGAGAVVLAPSDQKSLFSFLDARTEVQSRDYGAMFMQGDGMPTILPAAWSNPYFHITAAGFSVFNNFGKKAPVNVANYLLKKHKLRSKDVTLISHQASRELMDHWERKIQPGQYLDTMLEFANIVSATVPVTFAYKYHKIEKDYVLLLNPSAEFKAVGALLKRNG